MVDFKPFELRKKNKKDLFCTCLYDKVNEMFKKEEDSRGKTAITVHT